MPEAQRTAFARRVALLGLYASALWALADSQKLRGALWLLLPAMLSVFVGLPAGHARLRALAGAAFRIVLLLSLTFGVAWTLYPVLPQALFDAGPRVLGLALAAFGAAFLLWTRGVAPAHGAVPAGLALLAMGLLAPAGPPPLLPAGLATLALACYGALDAPALRPPGVSDGVAGRLARTALLLALGAALALGLVRLLPWAQPLVEKASAGWIDAGMPPGRSAVGSDSAALGELEKVALSRRVVMRVHAPQPQKLRVRVLTRFDGRAWHAPRTEARALAALPGAVFPDVPGSLFGVVGAGPGDADEPGAIRSRVVVSLPDAAALAAPRGTRLVQLAGATSADGLGLLAAPQPTVEIYGLVNRRSLRDDAIPDRAAFLDLPADTEPRLVQLAGRLSQGASPRLRVDRTLNHLDRECRYALDVGSFQGAQPVAEFLFEKKRGYCEYFASAAAVLLRLQGIPTRYVSGWNVTEENAAAGHFVVRESDAHAWIEAYLDDAGWVELDPTPAAQYAAVHAGEGDGLGAALEALAAALQDVWVRLRAGDPAALGRWLLARAWPLAALAGLIAVAALWRRRPRRAARSRSDGPVLPDDVRAVVSALDAAFARHGHPRPASRGLLEHERALAETAPLPPNLRAAARQAADWAYARTFGGAPEEAVLADALRRELSG